MKKILYLIAGANGSGKTTLAHELLREEKDLVFMNADEIAAKLGDTVGMAAGRVLLTETARVMAEGRPFVLESTISGSYHLRVLRGARERGYEINLAYVFLDFPTLNIARVKNRVKLGGHNVPEADIFRRYHKSLKNFRPTVAFTDAWKLYYNGGNGHELIATGCGDDVDILNDILYEKFKAELANAYEE